MSQRQGAPKIGESVATIIGPDIQVIGRVEGAEDLRVQGYVEGTIALTESLIIEVSGVVVADVRARDVVIGGILVGDVAASGRIVLQAGARVVGNLQAPRVSVAAGAALRGQVSMGEVADDGALEGAAGGRASFGRWRGGGTSSGGAAGGGRSTPPRGVVPRVNRAAGRSAAPVAPALARASARAQEREDAPSPRQPPRRTPPREIPVEPPAALEPDMEEEVADEAYTEAEAEDLIDVSEDGTVTTSSGKKQAARPRVPARGKHSVDHGA